MRLLTSLVFVAFAIFVAGDKQEIRPWRYQEGQRWILFPDGEGQIHLVDLQQEEPDARFDAQKGIKFFLYTRNSGRQEIKYGNEESLRATAYDPHKPVKMVSHGWNSKGSDTLSSLMRNAFLKSDDVNVIIIDWSKGSNTFYTSAVKNTIKAGAFVAKFIDWLCQMGTSPSAFHLMGHSLGGHLVGIAARQVTAGKIPYITSLDPANPLWSTDGSRIRATDAEYVEVIHTDAGGFGLEEPAGDADFYPNKGSDQPMCWWISIGCSHSMAYEYLADSIDHEGFMAQECANLKEALKGKCSNLSQTHMGGSRPKNVKGIFYLTTNKKRPYYRG